MFKVDCAALWTVYLGVCAMDGFCLGVCTIGHPLNAFDDFSSGVGDVCLQYRDTGLYRGQYGR